MIAVIDETTPEVGGAILYTVVSVITLEDEATACSVLRRAIPDGRVRPFHWSREGPAAKAAMVHCLTQLGVVAHGVVVACGRTNQEAAPAVALSETVGLVVAEGCDRVLIESRSRVQDSRDRSVMLDSLRRLGSAGDLSYQWCTKAEPLIWMADAIAGAIREHLVGREEGWFEQVTSTTKLEVRHRRLE